MNSDFITNLASKAASDLMRFSVEFPLFIIGFVVVLLIVTLTFRRKKDLSFSEMRTKESDKHIKQVLKNLKKEKLVDAVNLDMAGMIGSDVYVYFNIDFLFDFLIESGQEIEFEDDEKKVRRYIHKNENGMAQVLKKNIVGIYRIADDNKSTQISFFHLYFFATEFPNFIDIDLDGNFLLDTKYFKVDDIVDVFENGDKKFNFEEYFYFVIGRINEHVLDMKTYMKTKEIFSSQISQFLRTVEMRKKSDVKLKILKDVKPKIKEIHFQYGRQNRVLEEPKKIEDLMPKVTEENDITKEEIERLKNGVAQVPKLTNKPEKVSNNNSKNKSQKTINKSSEKEEKSDMNKPFIKNGRYTSQNQENKKEAREDIQNQKAVVAELEEENFVTEVETPKVVEVQTQDAELINSIVKTIQKEIVKNKDEDVSEDESLEKKDETLKTEFTTSTEIQKKQFNPMMDFTILLKKVHEDAVIKKASLFFKIDNNVYISTQYLFVKISMNYKEEDIFNSFSLKFVNWLTESLKIFNKGKEIRSESHNILIKKIQKQAGSIFIIFPEGIVKSKFDEEFFNKMPRHKEFKKYEHEKIDLIEYLKGELESEKK